MPRPPVTDPIYNTQAVVRARETAVAKLQNENGGLHRKGLRIRGLKAAAKTFGISQRRLRSAYQKAQYILEPHPGTSEAYHNRPYAAQTEDGQYDFDVDQRRAARVPVGDTERDAIKVALADTIKIKVMESQVKTFCKTATPDAAKETQAMFAKAKVLSHTAGLAISHFVNAAEMSYKDLCIELEAILSEGARMKTDWDLRYASHVSCTHGTPPPAAAVSTPFKSHVKTDWHHHYASHASCTHGSPRPAATVSTPIKRPVKRQQHEPTQGSTPPPKMGRHVGLDFHVDAKPSAFEVTNHEIDRVGFPATRNLTTDFAREEGLFEDQFWNIETPDLDFMLDVANNDTNAADIDDGSYQGSLPNHPF